MILLYSKIIELQLSKILDLEKVKKEEICQLEWMKLMNKHLMVDRTKLVIALPPKTKKK